MKSKKLTKTATDKSGKHKNRLNPMKNKKLKEKVVRESGRENEVPMKIIEKATSLLKWFMILWL